MPRHSQLVCQMLENIDRKALEDFQPLIRRYIKGRNGVYALYRGERLYYVGLAKNLRSRLKQHLKDRHRESWDRFSVYLTIGTGFIKEMESLLLRILKPQGNKQIGKFSKCQNLKRTFARDIRTEHREEFDEIFGRTRETAEPKQEAHRRPVLALYTDRRLRLRTIYKGKKFHASVRKDGTIRVGKRTFNSPSLAAIAVVRHPINGWYFWHYERAPGDWVRLRELRRNP